MHAELHRDIVVEILDFKSFRQDVTDRFLRHVRVNQRTVEYTDSLTE